MNHFVLLLRGINVGGHRKIKMADLKLFLENIGLHQVKTYIQSVNVVFSSEERSGDILKPVMERNIENHFGFPVDCMVFSEEEFRRIKENNPFTKTEEIKLLYTTFLDKTPHPESLKTLKTYVKADETFTQNGNVLYFCYRNGYGKAKMTNPFIEKKLGLQATTRNWKTVLKLNEMLENF
ncbi:DUF1697 domain-containing protein [Galbibacter sp. BG1]|uniref:DUF1697 domain-containing protein n=1 Tax=Galbibacter sp. BG1 TaxID=1170699 RepID=UPI0015B8FE8C|nr:DUF1697 domain-containing protein [Galbibacter sp. BG1]QLE01174.1 DUF1697 domain-containing protein [Galbibacter sp. BG1]